MFDLSGNPIWLAVQASTTRAFIGDDYILVNNVIFDLNGVKICEIEELPQNVDFVYVTRGNSKIIAIDWNGTLYILEGRFLTVKPEKPYKPSPGKPSEESPGGELAPIEPIGPVRLEEVPEVKRSFEDALKGRFGGGGMESLDFKAMAELGVTWKRRPSTLSTWTLAL